MTNYLNTTLSAAEIIEQLSVRIYEPPLSLLREDLAQVPEALRNVILFIDFDTEVTMGGILTFLENSTGKYLSETITTFVAIGAIENARHLAQIKDLMKSFGVDHNRLRKDFEGLNLFEITTFEKTHGKELNAMAEAIQETAELLYLGRGTEENPYELFQHYVDRNREEIITAVNSVITNQ
ncbi:MAG TPA: DUF4375 domain-containing protein [Pyrinomonadaceae bacterium]|jgi:hypothetical protein